MISPDEVLCSQIQAEYNAFVRPETHVIGEELVEAVLASSVPAHASKFKVNIPLDCGVAKACFACSPAS
jgi:hypothetical protein